MDNPINPALKDLEALVGEWTVWESFRASIEWLEDGAFLLYRLGDRAAGPPFATHVISRDNAADTYTMLYFDDRGVSRIYGMSFDGREWKVWRDAPGFHQRFTGVLSDDGNTITARWDKSPDGANWEHDFDLVLTRVT